MRAPARKIWLPALLVLVLAIAAVVAWLVLRPTQMPTEEVAQIATKSGHATQISKRGPQDDPDGHSFRTQYLITIEQVSADLITRTSAAGLQISCQEGVSGLPAGDMRIQIWQVLPAQTCSVREGEHTFGDIWLVQYSSGGVENNGGAYIGLEGDAYK